MRRVLFRGHGVTIHSYPAMLYAGIVTGVAAGNIEAHAAGVNPFRVLVATLALLPPALLGARLFYVASHWRVYRGEPRRIWNRNEGGAAQYGGLILVLPLSLPLTQALRLSWGGFWDVAAFTILTGMIFGRAGCLLNGCCAGRPSASRVALNLPNLEGVWVRRLPTPCLEAGWAAVLLVFAVEMRARMPFPGALFCIVAGGYATGRLVLESTRERSPEAARFTLHHGVSIVLILLSLSVLGSFWAGS